MELILLIKWANPDMQLGTDTRGYLQVILTQLKTQIHLALLMFYGMPAVKGGLLSSHLASVGACSAYPAVLCADLISGVDVVYHILQVEEDGCNYDLHLRWKVC